MNSTISFQRTAMDKSMRPGSSSKACVVALLLASTLAAAAFTVEAQPVAAAASESASTGAAKWDRRNFNGMWQLVNFDSRHPRTPDPAASAPAKDAIDDWGFDTLPQLKGKYLKDYEQRREADKKANRAFMATCKPNGVPALIAGPYGTEILQNASQLNWYQEFPGETWRIYLDGRPHPNADEYPATLTGHSTGKWEGDTLVVDTVNIRTDTLLYAQGRSANNLGHSEKMHIVQRIRLVDRDHLQIKGTVEDPDALVKPWQYTLTFHRHPGDEVIEYLCDDNNSESLDPTTGEEITEIPARRNQSQSTPE